jgi:CDP-glucose 4,6-dehydratase
MSEQGFWSGKKVLITGGNGFVASNLAIKLIKLKANVHLTVRPGRDAHNTIQMLCGKDLGYSIEQTDLFDYNEVKNILSRRQIDTIFHLAASAIVQQAAISPSPTLLNNIIPTINILEAARVDEIERIIVASSDKAYGTHHPKGDSEDLPYRENYALRGLDVYSTSKACADLICQAMAFQYKMNIIVTRCSNIYGPGDLNFTRLIPGTIMRILSNKPPIINKGKGEVLREYMYIDDIVRAYVFLAENADKCYERKSPDRGNELYGWPCFNVGSYSTNELDHPEKLSNIKNTQDVIKLIGELVHEEYHDRNIKEAVINTKPLKNFIEIPDQFSDSKKIQDFGFKSTTELQDGLRKTIKWYHKHFDFLKQYGANYL